MQPGLKAKSCRLQSFARGKSDSNAHYNTSAERPPQAEPGKRSATPNADVYVPNRQEIAASARLPVPETDPRPLSSPGRIKSELVGKLQEAEPLARRERFSSSRLAPGKAHLDITESHHDVFGGSQLGEGFMNSGLTSPANDLEAFVDRKPQRFPERQGQRLHREKMTEQVSHFVPLNFALSEDGRMSVVPTVHRYQSSHIKDGFNSGDVPYGPKPSHVPVTAQTHPKSVAQGPAKLPMRGVRISRAQSLQSRALTALEPDFKPQLTDIVDESWEVGSERRAEEAVLIEDSDDESSLFDRHDGRLATPKAKRQLGLGGRRTRTTAKPDLSVRADPMKDRKKRRQSLDYDDKMLSSMTSRDLQDEPFDVVPPLQGSGGHDASDSKLTTRLEQVQQHSEAEQHQFFANMSMEEWHDSGDWFADQFSDIMKRLQAARRKKRETIQAFETEAFQREEVIRSRVDAIDRKLQKMKQDGQRVVGDKTL